MSFYTSDSLGAARPLAARNFFSGSSLQIVVELGRQSTCPEISVRRIFVNSRSISHRLDFSHSVLSLPHSFQRYKKSMFDRLRGLGWCRHDIFACTPPGRSLRCHDGIATMTLSPRPSPPPAPLPRWHCSPRTLRRSSDSFRFLRTSHYSVTY